MKNSNNKTKIQRRWINSHVPGVTYKQSFINFNWEIPVRKSIFVYRNRPMRNFWFLLDTFSSKSTLPHSIPPPKFYDRFRCLLTFKSFQTTHKIKQLGYSLRSKYHTYTLKLSPILQNDATKKNFCLLTDCSSSTNWNGTYHFFRYVCFFLSTRIVWSGKSNL